jgi:xanthine dehydrogenase molybdenum-binding subunit
MSSSCRFELIGKDVPLKDAEEKVTGSLRYATDFALSGMVHGKILRSPHAHARIRRIDTSRAEAITGVLGVVTHRDAPEREWVAPWKNYKGRIMDDTVRFVGDEVAAVAAVDEDLAEYALDMIEIDYQLLTPVLDLEEAMKADALQACPDGNTRKPTVVEWGDVEKGSIEADVVAQSSMEFGSQHYAPIGTNACITEWSGDRVTLWTSTQTPSELRDAVMMAFGMPLSKIRVIAFPCGCSFGLWWSNNFHLVTVLLAKKVRRPVKIELDQEECFAGVKRRQLQRSRGKIGCKEDGTLVFIDVEHIFDNGGYGDRVNIGFTSADLWGRSPHGRYVVRGVSTNLLTAGCMRGVGDVTLNTFVERLLDMAAMKVNMDPLEFRLKNHVRTGDQLRMGDYYWSRIRQLKDKETPPILLSSEGLHDCLLKGAEAFEWKKKWVGWGRPYAVKGSKRCAIGVGTATHCCGIADGGEVSAVVHIHADGSTTLCCSMGRQGQGSETTQAQIVAETLGISLQQVDVEAGDTEVCPWSHGSTASTAAHRTGLATQAAAIDARGQILEIAGRHYLGVESSELEIKEGVIYLKSNPEKSVSLKEVVSQPILDTSAPPVIVGKSVASKPFTETFARHFAAHFVEVEVDTETGQLTLLRYLAAQDSGTVLNPKVLENQIIGGAVAGSGFALAESLVFDKDTGKILNPNFLDYKVFRSLDFPIQPKVMFGEVYDPSGPYGAKGGGETPICAPLPAIAQAVYNAIGVWLDIPMTPERVLRAIGKI